MWRGSLYNRLMAIRNAMGAITMKAQARLSPSSTNKGPEASIPGPESGESGGSAGGGEGDGVAGKGGGCGECGEGDGGDGGGRDGRDGEGGG